jgi:large subunit ribosomal protein L18
MTKTLKRRRLETRTDYRGRLELLKSKMPRLVVRKTNRYIIAQIVESEVAQDKILFGVNSKDLLGKGWPKEKQGSLKSLPAAYLAGFMLGKMAKKQIKEAILDIGMQRNVKGCRLYAVLKGVIDAGIEIAHSEESLPTNERITKSEINTEKIKESL